MSFRIALSKSGGFANARGRGVGGNNLWMKPSSNSKTEFPTYPFSFVTKGQRDEDR